MTSILIQSGARVPRSPWDIIAIVGHAAKGDGLPTLIGSLSAAVAKYGERLSLSKVVGKGIEAYGLVDAIETIYSSYVQVPIIAVNSTPTVAYAPIPAKNYTFVTGKVTLDHPNIQAPITVKNVAGDVTYGTPADYTIDAVRGEITRSNGGAIPAGGIVSVVYSAPNFTGAIDWIGAIGRVAPIANRNPSIITIAGTVVTEAIATALNDRALALGAIDIYTQPGASATAATPFLVSAVNSNSVAVYPIRTSDRGLEEAGVHLAAAAALNNYWESPIGDPLKGNSAPLSVADAALLVTKKISWASDRVQTAVTTNDIPFSVARLRAKAQLIANQVAFDWRQKPFDLMNLEGIGQAIRDALNREPEASLLPLATVNYNNERSSITDRRLAYDVILKGDEAGGRISEIIVFVS